MRAIAATVLVLCGLLAALLAPREAAAQPAPLGGVRAPGARAPARPAAVPASPATAAPRAAPVAPPPAGTDAADAGDDATAPALATPPPASSAGPAATPTTPPARAPGTAQGADEPREAPDARDQHGARSAHDEREERERWRIPSDLVNPFVDRPGLATPRPAHGSADAESWFIADSDLVDPWGAGAFGPFYGVRCQGRWCRPDPARRVFLAPARERPFGPLRHPRRRTALPGVDLSALVSATSVGDTARARLEAQATVHTGAFGLGLTLSTSTGPTRVAGVSLTHTRHALAVLAQHRVSDGTVSLDLGVAAGIVLTDLKEAGLAPLARVLATVGVPLGRNIEVLFRADALTTFVRPVGAGDDGPGAFEFGMGVGLRVATR